MNTKGKNKKKENTEKIKVYTVLEDYRPPKGFGKHVKVVPFDKLNEWHKEWVCENAIRLMEHPTNAELAFEQTLVAHHIPYEKQTFFRIDNKDYFLDFYFPHIRIAVEIDGSVHRRQRQYDRFRDSDFRKIGIRTIRIHNSDAYKKDVLQIIERKYFSKYSTVTTSR